MTTNRPQVVGIEFSAHGSSPLIRLSDYEALQAECEELRKDAERYRWLRADNAYFPEENYIRGGQELDAAIDAAMQEERNP